MRPSIIRVDQPTPCFLPENRDIFERIIDRTQTPWRKTHGDGPRLTKLIEATAPICGRCPERKQCLYIHGDDYLLGVIAGLTDAQRKKALGAA